MAETAREIQLSVPVMGDREYENAAACLNTGMVSTSGEFIPAFEEAVRELTGARHAIACQSGTGALHVAYRLAGVGLGDEVIVPTLTFIATVNPIVYQGARPVFIGCDEFMNLDPDLVAGFLEERCERREAGVFNRATGRRIAAIVPVHIFGNPCSLERLLAVGSEWGLPVVEDAAESLGSSWTQGALAGRHTGTAGMFGCISFNANKIITTGGGGMILTEDDELAHHARHLTTQAKADPLRFVHDEVGYNYRMTNLQAAVGVAQIATLGERIEAKTRNLGRYCELLADVDGVTLLGNPEGTEANNWFYSALIESAEYGLTPDALMERLIERGVHVRPVWWLSHRQAPYSSDETYDVGRAEWFADRVLNLPCTHTLTDADIQFVCDAIREIGRDNRA